MPKEERGRMKASMDLFGVQLIILYSMKQNSLSLFETHRIFTFFTTPWKDFVDFVWIGTKEA